MTSKVQPTADYWTDVVKMTSKVQPAADYWTVDQENLGTRLCYFWWILNEFWVNFEWIIKQYNIRPLWITPSEICRILQILRKPNSIILLLIIIYLTTITLSLIKADQNLWSHDCWSLIPGYLNWHTLKNISLVKCILRPFLEIFGSL